jgi:hypothetical protein
MGVFHAGNVQTQIMSRNYGKLEYWSYGKPVDDFRPGN